MKRGRSPPRSPASGDEGSPGFWYSFGADGSNLQSLSAPVFLAGDRDPVLSYEQEERPCYEAAGAPRRLFTFHNTGHYAFSNLCDLAPFLSVECMEDGWADMEVVQQKTRLIVTAAAGIHLRDQTDLSSWLDAGQWQHDDEVTLEADD